MLLVEFDFYFDLLGRVLRWWWKGFNIGYDGFELMQWCLYFVVGFGIVFEEKVEQLQVVFKLFEQVFQVCLFFLWQLIYENVVLGVKCFIVQFYNIEDIVVFSKLFYIVMGDYFMMFGLVVGCVLNF